MSLDPYLELNKGRPLRPLYVKALDFFSAVPEPGKVAVELGCGAGVETQDLISRGWEVFAYDKDPGALQSTEALVDPSKHYKLNLSCKSFEELTTLPRNYLVFAYHSLPFCDVDHFDRLMKAITDSIVGEGFFVGSFFGNQDEWVKSDKALGVDVTELQYRFDGFDFLLLNETHQTGSTLLNGPKHWHLIEVIARKKS